MNSGFGVPGAWVLHAQEQRGNCFQWQRWVIENHEARMEDPIVKTMDPLTVAIAGCALPWGQTLHVDVSFVANAHHCPSGTSAARANFSASGQVNDAVG